MSFHKDKSEALAKWITKNARVINWILSSVEPCIALNPRPNQIAADWWTYLWRVYHQENDACGFQLEYKIAEHTQGEKAIQ